MHMLIRRIIGISLVLLATLTLFPIAPVVLLLSFLIARTTRLKSFDRAVLFTYGFLLFEIAAVSRPVWVSIRYHDAAVVQAKSYVVQRWWALGIFHMAARQTYHRRVVSASLPFPRSLSLGLPPT